MALDDIVFPDGDPQNFIQTFSRGNTGAIDDIELEAGSNPGIPVEEVPVVVDVTATTAYTWVA